MKLEELRDSDKTIVIVSHSLDVVKKLCSRFIWIYDGKIKMDGNSEKVIDCYLEQVIEDHKVKGPTKIEKKDKYVGEITIDSPVFGEKIKIDQGILRIYGWELSETDESIVEIYIDEKYLGKATREERKDVIAVLGDQLGGYLANPTPGWEFNIEKNKLFEGKHILKVSTLDENGNLIKSKELDFYCIQ